MKITIEVDDWFARTRHRTGIAHFREVIEIPESGSCQPSEIRDRIARVMEAAKEAAEAPSPTPPQEIA